MVRGVVSGAALSGGLAFLLLLLSGCRIGVVPEPPPLSANVASSLTASGPVSVVNAQPSNETIEIGTAGVGTMTGSLHVWMGAAVDLMKSELTKRSVRIAEHAPKVLRFAVVNASLQGGIMTSTVTVQMTVETGDGRRVLLRGGGSSLQPPRAANEAVTDAVRAVLLDEKIRADLVR
jgi:hypothetical protein